MTAAATGSTGGRRRGLYGWLLVVATAAPFVVVFVGAVRLRWIPSFDIALTQMRVRDALSSHPPLIGVPGRFVVDGVPGSHPGPAALYLLTPVHRLGGQTPTALLAATVVLNAACAVGAVALVWMRRRSVPTAAAAVILVMAVTTAMGSRVAIYPWLPSLAVGLWVLCLAAMACVLAGDGAVLPIAVFGAVAAAQTHVSYAPVAVVAVVVGAACARADRRALVRSAVVLAIMMLPVLVDQLFRSGNLFVLARALRSDAAGAPLGWRDGTLVVLRRLDPVAVVGGRTTHEFGGSALLGAVLVTVWAAMVAVAVARLRGRGDWPWFDIGIGGYLAAAWLATVRLQGAPWPYLTLWTVPLALLLLARTGVLAATQLRLRPTSGARVVLVAAALVSTGTAAARLTDVHDDAPEVTAAVLAVRPEVLAALGQVDGPVVIETYDERDIGSIAAALALEAERVGMPVLFPADRAPSFGAHRSAARDRPPRHTLIVATGSPAEWWLTALPEHVVARFDPRTAAEVAESRRRHDDLAAALCASAGSSTIVFPNLLAVVLGAIELDPQAERAAAALLEIPGTTTIVLVRTEQLQTLLAAGEPGTMSC